MALAIKQINDLLSGYSYIDLFAGIGGFHIALSSFGAKCVFSSEWDNDAQQVYEDNFGIKPFGDITKIDEKIIPAHDILCGGFPCQAFSISGKQLGFEDTRGILFFDVVRIINFHKPKVVFLENVKNLVKHDKGKTLNTIVTTLEKLEYDVNFKVLNASDYGLPQNRERIFIVCFRKDLQIKNFSYPKPTNKKTTLFDIIEKDSIGKVIHRSDIEIYRTYKPEIDIFGNVSLPNKPIQIGKVNKGGQGERIYSPYGHSCTLSAYGGGVGAKTGLYLIDGKVRKLSPRECARLQGFPDDFKYAGNNGQAYKQFGNSVAINVLKEITKQIIKVI